MTSGKVLSLLTIAVSVSASGNSISMHNKFIASGSECSVGAANKAGLVMNDGFLFMECL